MSHRSIKPVTNQISNERKSYAHIQPGNNNNTYMHTYRTDYKFRLLPVIISDLGYVTNFQSRNLENLVFLNPGKIRLIRKLQILTIDGTVQICETPYI